MKSIPHMVFSPLQAAKLGLTAHRDAGVNVEKPVADFQSCATKLCPGQHLCRVGSVLEALPRSCRQGGQNGTGRMGPWGSYGAEQDAEVLSLVEEQAPE